MLLHARTDTPSLSRQDFAAFLQTFDSVLLSQNLRGLVKAAKDYCAGCTSKSRIWCRRIDDHVSHEACSEVRELQVHHAQMWTVAHSLRTQYVRWRNPNKPASDEIWAPPPKAPTPDPYDFLDILKGLCFWPRPCDGSNDHRSFWGIELVLSETSRISDTTTDSLVHKIQNAGHTFSVGLDNLCIVAYPGQNTIVIFLICTNIGDIAFRALLARCARKT